MFTFDFRISNGFGEPYCATYSGDIEGAKQALESIFSKMNGTFRNKQIEREEESCDIWFKIKDFAEQVGRGFFVPDDGIGYLHDGTKETEISVWKIDYNDPFIQRKYPYICWYNK